MSREPMIEPRCAPAASAVADRLAALAPRLGAGARGIAGLRRLSGGATQEIWSFALDAASGGAQLILRRAPGGGGNSEIMRDVIGRAL